MTLSRPGATMAALAAKRAMVRTWPPSARDAQVRGRAHRRDVRLGRERSNQGLDQLGKVLSRDLEGASASVTLPQAYDADGEFRVPAIPEKSTVIPHVKQNVPAVGES